MNAKAILEKIIGLDNEIMQLQDTFDDLQDQEKHDALILLFETLTAGTGEEDEIPVALIRITEMVCTLEQAPLILASGMSHTNESVRHLCGEALISLANEDGVNGILPAVEYALEKSDVSAKEMPFVLGWIDDPAAIAQIHRFLALDDPEIVYLAIESCVNAGDSDSLEPLTALLNDKREIEIEDDEDGPITVGMLAKEAVDLIEAPEE